MEIATLGLRVDGAEGIERTRDALGKFTKASEGAERSADGLAKGADRARASTESLGAASRSSSALVKELSAAAFRAGSVIGAALSLNALKNYADSWSDMQSQVGAATGDMASAAALMQRLTDIANASYSPLQQTVEGYARNVATLRDLGKSSAEAADFTESLNHMLVLTATRGERAASVQNALAKAMAVGKLQADGLETVLTNGGEVAQALAKELETTVSGLRAMASEGKITGQVIANSVIKPLDDVRERAAEMPATIGDAFVRANNNLTEFVGRIDKASGASSALAEIIMGFADEIRRAGDYVLSFGAMAGPVFSEIGNILTFAADNAEIAVIAMAGFYAPRMISGLIASKGAILALATAMRTSLLGAITSVNAALMSNVIGIAVATLATAGYMMYQAFSDGKRGVDDMAKSALDLKAPLASITDSFERLGEVSRRTELANALKRQQSAAEQADAAFKALSASMRVGMFDNYADWQKYRKALDEAYKSGSSLAPVLDAAASAAGVPADAVARWWEHGRAVESALASAGQAKTLYEALTGVMGRLAGAATGAASAIAAVTNADGKSFLERLTDSSITAGLKTQRAQLEALVKAGKLVFSPEDLKAARAAADIIDKANISSNSSKKAESELAEMVKQLRLQAATLGMTEEQAERYRIEVAKGEKGDRARALSLFDQIQAWNETEKAMKSAIDSSRQYLAFQQEMQVFQEKLDLGVAAVGMGDRQREMAEQALAVRQEYAQKRLDLEMAQQVKETALDQQQYRERLELFQRFEDQKLAGLQRSAEARAAAEADWTNGMVRAWQNFATQAQGVATQTESMFSGMLGTMKTGFGEAFESIIFDSENASDAMKSMAQNMLRSVVNALGQMAAQWLAYQAVQLLVGKTTQASGAVALSANAYATAIQAGLAAFASTAAIPVVGPAMAPAAMAGALSVTLPMAAAVTGTALAGMAHDGIDSVPATGTWLLEKGERVTTAQTSAKLDSVLERIDARQRGAYASSESRSQAKSAEPRVVVQLMGSEFQGAQITEERGTTEEEVIVRVMSKEFLRGGQSFQALASVTNVRRVGS